MKNKLLIVFCIIVLIGFSSSIEFKINATLNGNFATLLLKTNDNSNNSIDIHDFLFISPPNNYSVLYSNVSNKQLIVDSRNSTNNLTENFSLVYFADNNYTGDLILKWDKNQLKGDGWRLFLTLSDKGANNSTILSTTKINSATDSPNFTNLTNNSQNRYFELESYYSYCGNNKIEGLDGWKDCEIINGTIDFNGATCISYTGRKYDGNLTCTNICKIDSTNCSIPIYEDKKPDNSGSSGGGGSITTSGECTLGGKRCTPDGKYQVCKLSDKGIPKWNTPLDCGGGLSCLNGVCVGCKDDFDCKEGICLLGKCETNCDLDCSKLGAECGKKLVCGKLLDCGSCSEGFCTNGICTQIVKDSIKITEEECTPNYLCSPWTECKVSFDANSIIFGKNWFKGIRERTCFDSNKCYSTVKEKEACSLEIETITKNTTLCGINYIEIYEKNSEKLLVRKRESSLSNLHTIELFLFPNKINCEIEKEIPEKINSKNIFHTFDLRKIWRLFR